MLFRTLLRAASAWFLWRWLAPRWKSTLALVVGWLLVTVLHSEYVEYVRITDSTELLWLSYLIKWIVVLVGISAYVWFSLLGSSSTPATSEKPNAGGSTAPDPSDKLEKVTGDDGFDFLRDKPKLESRGDMIVGRGQHPDTTDC